MYQDPACTGYPASPAGCVDRTCRFCRYSSATQGSPLWPICPASPAESLASLPFTQPENLMQHVERALGGDVDQRLQNCQSKATPGDIQQGLGLYFDSVCANSMQPGCRRDQCRFCRRANAAPGYEAWPMCPGERAPTERASHEVLENRYIDEFGASEAICPITPCPAARPWWSSVSKTCKPKQLQSYYIYCARDDTEPSQQLQKTGQLKSIYDKIQALQQELRDNVDEERSVTMPVSKAYFCFSFLFFLYPSVLCKTHAWGAIGI